MHKPTVALFPEPATVGPRDWGTEELLVLSSKQYSLKKLTINAGHKGGLQYHRLKDEAAYVLSGTLRLRWDDGTGTLKEGLFKEGDFFHFPPGAVHQEEAVTDVVLLEVSTPHFNDRVRVEEKYGQMIEGGLPTTTEPDIELR